MNDPGKKSQLDHFKETARKLGAEDDEATFKEKLGAIARQKPKDHSEKPSKRSKDQ